MYNQLKMQTIFYYSIFPFRSDPSQSPVQPVCWLLSSPPFHLDAHQVTRLRSCAQSGGSSPEPGTCHPALRGPPCLDGPWHCSPAAEHCLHRQPGVSTGPQEDRFAREERGVQPEAFCGCHHEDQRTQV